MFHEPLALFCRAGGPVGRLSELAGKRLAIGLEGSGTRVLALILLKANGIEPGGVTTLLDLGGEEAAEALIGKKIDAAFLMKLDEVGAGVNRMKVPLAYSEQYYELRDHIMFVRDRFRGA